MGQAVRTHQHCARRKKSDEGPCARQARPYTGLRPWMARARMQSAEMEDETLSCAVRNVAHGLQKSRTTQACVLRRPFCASLLRETHTVAAGHTRKSPARRLMYSTSGKICVAGVLVPLVLARRHCPLLLPKDCSVQLLAKVCRQSTSQLAPSNPRPPASMSSRASSTSCCPTALATLHCKSCVLRQSPRSLRTT